MKKTFLIVASYAESFLNFRYNLIKELVSQGYSVITCAPKNDNVSSKLSELNVKFIPTSLNRTGSNPFSDLFYILELVKIMRNTKPDIVFSYAHKPVIYASIAAKIARIPKIYSMITGMGYVFSDSSTKSKFLSLIATVLFKISLKFNNIIFFQNIDNLESFLKMKIINQHTKTVLINGSGIDTELFKPATLPDSISFLLIARLLIDKGIREYIAAAKIIKNKYPNTIFKLVGWIDTNPNSISQHELTSWINEGIIQFFGKLEDVRPIITQSSIYVLPSYCEGTPRTVLEAMAMSRPIITTDAPGCKETVIDGINGFKVPVKNIQQLADAMEKFIIDPQLCDKMGHQSRELALKKYDVNTVNQTIINAIQTT